MEAGGGEAHGSLAANAAESVVWLVGDEFLASCSLTALTTSDGNDANAAATCRHVRIAATSRRWEQ